MRSFLALLLLAACGRPLTPNEAAFLQTLQGPALDASQVRLHPETALHVLTEEQDLVGKLERAVGFDLELRDDPLLRPDEFKLVVRGAEQRDVTERYAVA